MIEPSHRRPSRCGIIACCRRSEWMSPSFNRDKRWVSESTELVDLITNLKPGRCGWKVGRHLDGQRVNRKHSISVFGGTELHWSKTGPYKWDNRRRQQLTCSWMAKLPNLQRSLSYSHSISQLEIAPTLESGRAIGHRLDGSFPEQNIRFTTSPTDQL